MTNFDLASTMAENTGITFQKAHEDLDAILECITEALEKKDRVKLVDFGVFEVVRRAPRKGFNPYYRKETVIPACNEPVFKPGKELKEIIKEIPD